MTDISFTDLIPERIRINGLPDGSSLEMMRREEMDLTDSVEMEALDGRMKEIQTKMKKVTAAEARRKLLEKIDEIQVDFIMLVSIDADRAAVEVLKFGHKTAIIQHWASLNTPPAPSEGNAQSG
jgi:hypothetical protein